MNTEQPSDSSRRRFLGHSVVGLSAVASLTVSAESNAAPSPDKVTNMSPDQLRAQLVTCLGGPWPRACPLKPEHRETIQKDGYRVESLTYEVEPGDRVPAMLLVPNHVSAKNPAPAIAIWHQHAG